MSSMVCAIASRVLVQIIETMLLTMSCHDMVGQKTNRAASVVACSPTVDR